ncbi:molybdopterin-dependent oxidoreductase [Ruegeria jejuensis]|uniref:molybdopterin-dependent oxidoreductase n=1 Tax=Ruegeria jejuensis TaxID=3233338 RepID=UPI00355C699F
MTVAHWGAYHITEGDEGIDLHPNPENPSPAQIGDGWLSAATDKKARILQPAIRKGWLDGDAGRNRCDDAYMQMPWDEVLDIAAGEIARVSKDHGNQAIFGGSYGWASAGRFHHSQSQLRRFLNLTGGYVAARDTYSHAAAEVILPYITGMPLKQLEEGLTSWPLIAENCSLMLAFGGISGRTAQIASGGTWSHEVQDWLRHAARNRMRTICVSPLDTDYDTVPAETWLPIRPGSDVALMLALSHELIRNGWQDEAFLARYTHGYGRFRAYVMGESDGIAKSPEWAGPLCDLEPAEIAELAATLSREKVMISVAWGLQRADHGEQTVWAALALACLLGQIGQPGTGFGFGYGSTTPPGRPRRFIHWPSVPQGNNAVADFIPVARVADMLLNPGGSYTYDGQTRSYPDIRLVYWCGGNPFHHHQDLLRLERAWTRPETVIVQDHSWTATAKRADIVLPATTPLEREDLFLNRRDPNLIAMRQALQPVGDGRHDHDIFCGLATRLGLEQAFSEGRDAAGWQAWLWDECRKVASREGIDLPEYERFLEAGHFEIPDNHETRILFRDFIDNPEGQPLATPSGKIELYSEAIAAMDHADCPGHPAWLEPAEWLGAAEPDQLHLISNQPATRLHSQLDNGLASRSHKIEGRERCRLHPAKAAALGLREGDVVRIFNDRGACLAAVELSDHMRQDVVVLPTGAWLDLQDTPDGRLDVHGNPNVLTIDKGASGLTQGNISHTALVRVEKWVAPLPDIRAFDPPRFVPRTAQDTGG